MAHVIEDVAVLLPKRAPVSVPAARCRVTKVRQFQKLAHMSAGDGQLQQRLKQLLKLSKEKWDSACEHAKTAVQVCGKIPPLLH